MAFVAVDQDGEEKCFELEPHRTNYEWWDDYDDLYVTIPKGSIKKLIGIELTWEDEPVELEQFEIITLWTKNNLAF